MYITKIRAEEEASRKHSDDLLVKAGAIIDKGDLLTKFEKLVVKAERDFSFNVNYTSGTVLERNSLLNWAVINKRKNIVKWLIEEKHSDIESCDRGNFTPLLNAGRLKTDQFCFEQRMHLFIDLILLIHSMEWR
jgi:hypothetical protein